MMNRFTICIAAAFALVPFSAVATCGSGDCSVGAFGQGGESSGGKAQGSYFVGPGENPGVSVSVSGNASAGHVAVSRPDGSSDSLAGTDRNGIVRGMGTGEFGDWTGLCDEIDFPDCN